MFLKSFDFKQLLPGCNCIQCKVFGYGNKMFQYLKTENVFVTLSLDVLENFLGMLKLNRVKNCCSYRFFRLVGDLDSATSVQLGCCICLFFFLAQDSLHVRHYKAWSYKKQKHKKIKAYRKSVQKKPIQLKDV